MASTALITVKTIEKEVRTRKDGVGTYTSVLVTSSDGQVFSGYENQLPEGLVEGVKSSVLFQPNKRKDGTTFNQIISLGLGTSTGTAQVSNKKTIGSGGKTFDSKGARVGGVLHDAVALAIHNAGTNPVKTKIVKDIANELLEVAKDLES